jgi:hypothetical protein
MMKRSVVLAVMLAAALVSTARPGEVTPPFESRAVDPPTNEIDKLVFAMLTELGIPPANLCSDAVFVRRAYMDIIGTLPTAHDAKAFLADESPAKRSALIDRLLETDSFADYWSMKWGDVLRVKAEFPINLWPNAVQAYDHWIRTSIHDNMPYDRFVREMLTSSGSNFRVGPVNFYRAGQSREPQALAQAVALTFMGTRADKWPKEQLDGMAVFFSQIDFKPSGEWKEEIVRFDPDKTAGQPGAALPVGVFPDGANARLSPSRDPREVFADWLIDPKNPWFTRNIANRVWAWLLGRGIIHEPDDIRPDNPPVNPELLALLERELIAAKYDLKHLYRLILNSQTWQLSAIPAGDKPEAEANFAHYPLRRLEAEVLIDALNQISGTTEKYSSAVPEPFTFIPEEQRSIELADGSITSSFLEMFGRSSRDTGLVSERNDSPSAAQRLHLLNSSHVQRKIEQGPNLRPLQQPKRPPREVADTLYLTILSRFPTDDEWKTVEAYTKTTASRRDAVVDLAWALINSAEFLYRH